MSSIADAQMGVSHPAENFFTPVTNKTKELWEKVPALVQRITKMALHIFVATGTWYLSTLSLGALAASVTVVATTLALPVIGFLLKYILLTIIIRLVSQIFSRVFNFFTEPDLSQVFSSPETLLEKRTEEIQSAEDLDNLQEIAGQTIEDLEAKARPGELFQSGFLGSEESLIERIKSDWQAVEKMGMTHEELADLIDALLRKFVDSNDFQFVSFCPEEAEREELRLPRSNKSQQFMGHRTVMSEGQEDLLGEENWNYHLKVMNLASGASVILTPATSAHIRKYGFYQGGGVKNPFCVDPMRLVAFFTGYNESDLRTHFDIPLPEGEPLVQYNFLSFLPSLT